MKSWLGTEKGNGCKSSWSCNASPATNLATYHCPLAPKASFHSLPFQWSHTLQCYCTVEGEGTECPNILRGNFPRVTRGEDSVRKHWWATLGTLQDWIQGRKRLLNWMWPDTRGLSCGWLNWTKPGRWEHGHYHDKSTCLIYTIRMSIIRSSDQGTYIPLEINHCLERAEGQKALGH